MKISKMIHSVEAINWNSPFKHMEQKWVFSWLCCFLWRIMESRLLNLKRNEEQDHSEIKQNSNKKSKFQIIYDQKLVIRVIIITYCGKGVIQNCHWLPITVVASFLTHEYQGIVRDHNTVGIRVIKNHLLPITVVMFENFTYTMSTKMLCDISIW